MTEKHTPGPWEVRELRKDRHGIIKRDGTYCTYCIWTDDYSVADYAPGLGPIRKLADAHLIAAAPELLKACEAALEDLLAWHFAHVPYDEKGCANVRSYGECTTCEAIELLRAAIAKAKGENNDV
jgi:hypothetical protein